MTGLLHACYSKRLDHQTVVLHFLIHSFCFSVLILPPTQLTILEAFFLFELREGTFPLPLSPGT